MSSIITGGKIVFGDKCDFGYHAISSAKAKIFDVMPGTYTMCTIYVSQPGKQDREYCILYNMHIFFNIDILVQILSSHLYIGFYTDIISCSNQMTGSRIYAMSTGSKYGISHSFLSAKANMHSIRDPKGSIVALYMCTL